MMISEHGLQFSAWAMAKADQGVASMLSATVPCEQALFLELSNIAGIATLWLV